MKSANVAMTGTTGSMGSAVLKAALECKEFEHIRILARKPYPELVRLCTAYSDRLELVVGNLHDAAPVRKLVSGMDYVVNMAAVIPPKADHDIPAAETANIIGVRNLIDAIAEIKVNQPKLIHISTLAVYGDRNYKHPWARVGDPLLPSAYDCYSTTKAIGERLVLESNIEGWVVLRQTAMLYNKMLTNNIHDGLMFHTTFNGPLEWVTAEDSALLIKNIVCSDLAGRLDENNFWKQVFNIGGGAKNRMTGYETFDRGFRTIGGSAKQYLKPNWNALRNFHGCWFADTAELDNLFHFITQDVDDYWENIRRTHWYYNLARAVPKFAIRDLAIERLLKDSNSPWEWEREGLAGRIIADFGSEESFRTLSPDWSSYSLVCENQLPDGTFLPYGKLKDIENAQLLSHGYDESKPTAEIDRDDLQKAAAFRGGSFLSPHWRKGDLFAAAEWKCSDGHVFKARPYTVLKAGHWCPLCFHEKSWEFDRLAKANPFYAQVWYDSHTKAENYRYYYDGNGKAQYDIL